MFSDRRKEIPTKGIPHVVWIGNSHIRRLKEWFYSDAKHLPIEDIRFLRQAGWASSGGSKFNTFVDRIGGFKLPRRQRHQGDQRTELIVKHPYPYAFIRMAYPKARVCYIGIIRCPDWPPLVCWLAKWIGDYMRSELGSHLINIDKRIKRYHFLQSDLVHINRMGYYRFYDTASQSVATLYYQWMSNQS